MMKSTPSRSLLALCLLGLIACGGDDDDGGASGLDASKQGFLGDYCRVTLLREMKVKLWYPIEDNTWESTSSTTLAAGTPLVLAAYYGASYGFTSSGELRKFTPPGNLESFHAGTDVTEGCDEYADQRLVFFEPTTLHPNEDGSGASCTIAAGEGFAGLSYSLDSGKTMFTGDSIQARCGFSPAHGVTTHVDTLFVK